MKEENNMRRYENRCEESEEDTEDFFDEQENRYAVGG